MAREGDVLRLGASNRSEVAYALDEYFVACMGAFDPRVYYTYVGWHDDTFHGAFAWDS